MSPAIEDGIADSVRYLESDAALRSLAEDTYLPKWHSPWWHMVTLWELGEARRIPEPVQRAMIDGLDALPPCFPRLYTWHREPASRFPLLEATSVVGEPSAVLTRQWAEVRQIYDRLVPR